MLQQTNKVIVLQKDINSTFSACYFYDVNLSHGSSAFAKLLVDYYTLV